MALDPKDLVIRGLAEEMYTFDEVITKTVSARDKVIDKLVGFVDKFETINIADAEETSVKMGVINTTLRALADQEAASTRRVTAKLRHQESKRSDNTSENVIQLLKSISLSQNGANSMMPPIDLNGITLDLERSLREAGESISETELRMDPDDLS